MDQTHFSTSQEHLQSPPIPEQVQAPKPKKKKSTFLIVVIIFTVVLVLLALAISLTSNQPQSQTRQTPSFQRGNTRELSEFHQQLLEIETELKAADPSEIDLVIPPIDYTISLTLEN